VQLSINGTPDKTVTVSGGSTNTSFSYTNAITPATLSLDETYECENGASESCDVFFDDAGFVFSNIDDQVSGLPFNGITIQAVKDVAGVCEPLFSGNKNIDMAMEYQTPDKVTVNTYAIGNNDIDKNAKDLVNSYSEVQLNFLANSIADLGDNQYNDAGQIKLHAKYTEPATIDDPSFTITGSSNAFWVSPHHFSVIATNDENTVLDGNTDNTTTTHAAGNDFTLTISAHNFLEGITTNYTAANAQLRLERTGPTNVGVEGTLSYSTGQNINSQLAASMSYQNSSDVTFTDGVYQYTGANYSEVGITNLSMRDDSYGSAPSEPDSYIPTGSADIGRFIPDHFELSVVQDGSFQSLCEGTVPNPDIDLSYAYSGQMSLVTPTEGNLKYIFNPSFLITAKSSNCNSPLDCTTTQNYTGDFMKLVTSGIDIEEPTTDALKTGVDTDILLNLVADLKEVTAFVSESNGEVTYEFHDGDNFVYTHEANAEVGPFPANIDLAINSVVDGDFVAAIDSDGGALNSPLLTLNLSGKEIRFGRARLDNSYGPETSDLSQPFSVQYLNASGTYVVNEDDGCTGFDSSNIRLTNGTLDQNRTGVNSVNGQLDDDLPNGETRSMFLDAPEVGNQGTINVEYDIYSWLKYDWTWNGVAAKEFDENPSAIATFGLFRGNDRIIYQREVNN
jgi:hypothetical protein